MSCRSLLAGGLIAGAALTAMAQQPPPASTEPSSSAPIKPSMAAEMLMSNDDRTFMSKAASSNQFEIQASQMAQQKATDPALKNFAQHMVDDHTKAGRELDSLAQKKNLVLPTAMLKPDQSMLDGLAKKSGTSFDNAYRKEMMSSHQKAVSLFDNEARKGQDSDIKSWASQTLPILQQHGGMANALKKAS